MEKKKFIKPTLIEYCKRFEVIEESEYDSENNDSEYD